MSLALEPVTDALTFPVHLTSPPNDARLFVCEKGGTIAIIENDQVLPTPFLDISSLIAPGDEQGLLGLAFPPDYATSGRFYVSYVQSDGSSAIARYSVSGVDANQADAGSAEILFTETQPDEFHNGGTITFGPDDHLWIGLGDGNGAISGDPLGTAQSLDDRLGSLLRIDVSRTTGYDIPADNPYVGQVGVPPENYSIGLRNPWKFSFDPQTDDLYIADVGQGDAEEVTVTTVAGASGANFGWNIMEGDLCFNPPTGCSSAGLVAPTFTYLHAPGRCSITGGYVYRGDAIPELHGTYFYADFCSGAVSSFVYSGGQVTDEKEWPSLSPGSGLTSFGRDANGELYVLLQAGDVYRIIEN